MENTKIEWCDHTFNPWIGCTKVSPGCQNCYAEALDNQRFSKSLPGATKQNPISHWGPRAPRHRTSPAMWDQPLKWSLAAYKAQPPIRPRVLCASLADWLDDAVPLEWLADLLNLIDRTPDLDWLLLTKRPENWRPRLQQLLAGRSPDPAILYNPHHSDLAHHWLHGRPPDNIWLGTTVEDQLRANQRITHLLSIPAKIRFLSCEPLLGPVDFRQVPGFNKAGSAGQALTENLWVIAGGESGPAARPMHPDWARTLRDQCAAAGVPFLFKQWGEWIPSDHHHAPENRVRFQGEHHEFTSCGGMIREGKKSSRRLLDGHVHSRFPFT